MICNNCGNQVPDNSLICPYCGNQFTANAAPQQPQYAQPQYSQPQYSQPQYGQPQYGQPQYGQPQYGQPMAGNYTEEELSKSALKWGILSLAFCLFIPILGIIFGSIGMKRANNYVAAGYPIHGRAMTGRILSIIGFIGGIVFAVIYFFALVSS